MKICNCCNNTEPDTSKFCSNCGKNDFRFYPDPDFNSTQNGFQNDNTVPPFFEESPETIKNRKKRMGLVLMAIAIIIVLLVVIAVIKANYDSEKYYNSNSQITEEANPFMRGTIDSDVYKNRWASLQFKLDNGWENASSEQYKSYEDEISTCDFYSVYNNELIAVVFVDLSKESKQLTEDEYFEQYMQRVIKEIPDSRQSDASYRILCGKSYLTGDIFANVNSNEVVMTSCMRKSGNHLIIVNATSFSKEENEKNLALFEEY